MKNVKKILFGSKEKPKVEIKSTKYNSLDMPLKVFINALVDEDFSEIEDFTDIYYKYCEEIGGQEFHRALDKAKDLALLKATVHTAYQCYDMMKLNPTKELFDLMQELEYPTTVTEYEESKMELFLSQILPRMRYDKIQLEIKLSKMPENEEGKKYDRGYFAQMFVAIHTGLGVMINDSISVRQYCAYVKTLKLKQQSA